MSLNEPNHTSTREENSSLLNRDEILENLRHPDSEVRLRAVKDLISLGEPTDMHRLGDLLGLETDAQIGYEIRKGIGILRPKDSREMLQPNLNPLNLTRIDEALKSEDEETFNKVFRYIVQHRLKEFLPVLKEHCTSHPSPYRKGLLIRMMVSLGGEVHFPSLVNFLNDDDPRVISTAIEALEGIGNTKALGFIAQFVTHSNNRVQATAMKALYNLGDQSALKLFEKMVYSTHVAYRNSAAYALKEMKIPESLPLLKTLFADSDPSVTAKAKEALEALSKLGIDDARQILDDTLEQTSLSPSIPPEKMSTPQLMDWIGKNLEIRDQNTVEKLVARLRIEKDERLIASLIMALAVSGSQEIIEDLIPFLEHSTHRIRANTVECLGLLLPVDQKSILLPMLEDINNRVIGNSIIALIHDFKEKTLKALETLAQSSNLNEQLTAVYCIGTIGTGDVLSNCDYLLESPFTEVKEKMVKALEDLSQDSASALRILKGFNLRIASFQPDERPQVRDQEITAIEQNAMASNEQQQDSSSLQADKREQAHDSKKHRKEVAKTRKSRALLDQLELGANQETLAANTRLENVSSGIFFVALAMMLLTNLCSAIIQEQFTFYSIFSKPLRTVLINDFIFSAFFIIILPATAISFLLIQKEKYSREPFLISFLMGLFLHQYVQLVDIMQIPVAPLLNFLSSDVALLFLESYSGIAKFSSQILSLPWLLAPLVVEGLVRFNGLRRVIAGSFALVLIFSTIWLIYLNLYASAELERVKASKQRRVILYKQEEVQGLIAHTRLQILALESRIFKTTDENQKKYLLSKLESARSDSNRYNKILVSLQAKLKKISSTP